MTAWANALPAGARRLSRLGHSPVSLVAGAIAAAVFGVAYAIWPVTAGLLAAAACLGVIAIRAPKLGFMLAVVAVGAEGTIKELLANEGSPIPLSADALGALLLDLVLFWSLAVVVWRDRGSTLGRLWANMTRFERIVLGLIALWWIVSLIQTLQGGHPSRGVAGFRLTQAYFLVALGAATVFASRQGEEALKVLLIGLGLVSTYAAIRGIIGPSATEQAFSLSKQTVTHYGSSFRDVGSFSSTVGMTSYLVPAAVFAGGYAVLVRRHQFWAWLTVVTAVIAIATSYGRGPLVAGVAGVTVIVGLFLLRPDRSWTTKLATGVALLTVVAVAVGAVVAASHSSTATSAHLRGLLTPSADPSISERIRTIKADLRTIEHHPLGLGLGTVGAATRNAATGAAVTADDSYLKVFMEQGVLVGAIFLAGILGFCVAIARRIRRLRGQAALVATAAFGGLVAFIVLMLFGEYVEQPGKVVAWAFAGLAASLAFLPHESRAGTVTAVPRPRAPLRGVLRERWHAHRASARLVFLAATLFAVVAAVTLNLNRARETSASIRLFHSTLGYNPIPIDTQDVSRLIQSRLGRQFAAFVGTHEETPSTPARINLRRAPGIAADGRVVPTLVLTGWGPTPARATTTTSIYAQTAVYTSTVSLARSEAAALARAGNRQRRRALRRRFGAVAPPRAANLQRQRSLRRFIVPVRSPFVLGSGPKASLSSLWADRLVARLPGVFPARPNPWVAGLFGLLLALVIGLLLPTGSRQRREAQAQVPSVRPGASGPEGEELRLAEGLGPVAQR